MQRRALIGAAIVAAVCGLQAADRPEITFTDGRIFPESLTSTKNGDVYISGASDRTACTARPAKKTKASVWIQPKSNGLQTVLGVFADESAGMLWVCASASGGRGGAPVVGETAMKAFNLKDASFKASYPFPGNGLCNDMAVAKDGTVYATDTTGARVLRLKKGATALDVWAADPMLLATADGVALLADGHVYVNSVGQGTLLRIPGEGRRLGRTDRQARNVAPADAARRHAVGRQQDDAARRGRGTAGRGDDQRRQGGDQGDQRRPHRADRRHADRRHGVRVRGPAEPAQRCLQGSRPVPGAWFSVQGTQMRIRIWSFGHLVIWSLLLGSRAASAQTTLPYDHVHLAAPDQAAAVEWYRKNLGGQLSAEGKDRVTFGKTRFIFLKNDTAQPSAGTAIDHIGFSFADLDAKMKELEAAGVKIVTPVRDVAGLFKLGFIEDPWA